MGILRRMRAHLLLLVMAIGLPASEASARQVPPPTTVRSCAAVPVTLSGPPLQELIKKLEQDVKRDTDLLRGLDRRFKMTNRELERLGNTACQQRAELQQRLITDSFGAAFTGLKALNERDSELVLKSLTTNANRQAILNILENRAHFAGASRAPLDALGNVIRNGYDGQDLRTARLAFDGLESVYKTGVALAPSFTCTGSDDEPEWNPATKVLTTSLRQILGEVNPWFKVIDPILDEDNWIAGFTYVTTRNRIEQYNELNIRQLNEWQAHTCNLQRHTRTLAEARRLAAAELASQAPARTGGGAGSIVKLVGGIAAVAGGAIAYTEYKKTMEESDALISSFSNLPTGSTGTSPASTGGAAFNGTYRAQVTRTCVAGGFPASCQQAPELAGCSPTNFTFTVTNGTIRDCGSNLTGTVQSNGSYSGFYTGSAGGVPISGRFESSGTFLLQGQANIQGSNYTVRVNVTKQ